MSDSSDSDNSSDSDSSNEGNGDIKESNIGEKTEGDVKEDIKKDVSEYINNYSEEDLRSFLIRKSFPLCFIYVYDDLEKSLEDIKGALEKVIPEILEVNIPLTIKIYKTSREEEFRVFCPDVFVNCDIFLDIRSLLIQYLELSYNSKIIPDRFYTYDVYPTMFSVKVWDTALNKFESHQEFTNLLEKTQKTEDIEKFIINISHQEKPLTNFTESYKKFISEYEETPSIRRNNVTLFNGDSEEQKKELGKYYEKCLEIFRKYHPDSKLNNIKLMSNNSYYFDFAKSKNLCRLCSTIHKSNRQFLIFNKDTKKAYYKCFDSDASGKYHSFKLD